MFLNIHVHVFTVEHIFKVCSFMRQVLHEQKRASLPQSLLTHCLLAGWIDIRAVYRHCIYSLSFHLTALHRIGQKSPFWMMCMLVARHYITVSGLSFFFRLSPFIFTHIFQWRWVLNERQKFVRCFAWLLVGVDRNVNLIHKHRKTD